MSVRLVLDTSSLLAYVAADTRAVLLGELLATVEEGGDSTGVPALALIGAHPQVSPAQWATLMELTSDDDGPAVILPVLGDDVTAIATLTSHLPYDLAHAAAAAHDHGALLATYQRDNYRDVISQDDILDL